MIYPLQFDQRQLKILFNDNYFYLHISKENTSVTKD